MCSNKTHRADAEAEGFSGNRFSVWGAEEIQSFLDGSGENQAALVPPKKLRFVYSDMGARGFPEVLYRK